MRPDMGETEIVMPAKASATATAVVTGSSAGAALGPAKGRTRVRTMTTESCHQRRDYEAVVRSSSAEPVTITLDDGTRVSGLIQAPPRARACYVLAHGAGAGMAHPFLAAVAAELAGRGIATLRYQFPYMERGSRRPDPPPRAHATVRAAVAEAARLTPGLPLFAGGKSFGGRMTSQAQAQARLPACAGSRSSASRCIRPDGPSNERGRHLTDVRVPMLFLQGTRDALALPGLLAPLCEALGARATLRLFADADHSFHVPARSGRTDAQVRGEMLDALAAWIDEVLAGP